MKIFVVVLTFLLAGSNAIQPATPEFGPSRFNLPESIAHLNALDQNEQNLDDETDVNAFNEESLEAVPSEKSTYIIRTLITYKIKNFVQNLRQSISGALNIPKYSLSVNKNERGFAVHLKNLELVGLDNINIDNIDVNIWGTKATIILRLPKIEVSCGHVGVDHTVFKSKLSAETRGTVSVINIVLIVNTIIDPIRLTVKDVNVSLILAGPVQSKLNVQLLGADISRAVNDLVERVIPAVLDDNKSNIDAFLQAESVPYLDFNEPLGHAPSFYL